MRTTMEATASGPGPAALLAWKSGELEIVVIGPEGLVAADDAELREMLAWEDPDTGLEGPDFWRRILVSEIARSRRYGRPLTVVLVDITGMGELRMTWGAEVAAQALRDAASCVHEMARSSDHCARIGPRRLGVLLTETDEIAAINFIERVREAGAASVPRVADRLGFTFGWASPNADETADALVLRAESRMAADAGA